MDMAMSTTSTMAASFYNETSSDEFPSDSSSSSNEGDGGSDDDGESSLKFKSLNKIARKFSSSLGTDGNRDGDSDDGKRGNIFLKLLNRENTGYFNSRLRGRSHQRAFRKVPTRLSFCLKDIVPYCYLQGHMFMGLTVCGQFLISYKVCYDENSLANAYNFSTHYKYTLYFWIYRPHQPLGKYYKICLFDDHGVDNLKTVTMTQWLSSPHVLIVHGASEYENEDSYLTIVRVPKLGCLDCKELRDFDADGYIRCDALCIKCNLTIHTKYSTTESDPRFNPHLNLICPERIVFVANGFVHMLHIELEAHKQLQQSPQHQFHSNHLQQAKMTLHHSHTPPAYCSPTSSIVGQSNMSTTTNFLSRSDTKTANDSSQTDTVAKSCDSSSTLSLPSSTTDTGCDNKNNIVARIIADFSEFENDIQTLSDKNNRRTDSKTLNYNELIFTCGSSSIANPGGSDSDAIGKNSTAGRNQTATKVTLLNHQGRRNHKIITKSYSNCVTTVDLQFCGGSGASSASDKDNAYVFSEDNENCEKIGTFRKRRLADKKYAFSEDNSENIIPFTKARLTTQTPRIHRTFASNHYHSSHPGTVYLSTSSSQSYETTSHLHRASPSQGFRSPCGSPVGSNRFLRSPPGRTSQKSPTQQQQQQQQQQLGAVRPLNSLSPRQIVFPKRAAGDRGGDLFSTISPILSPRRDDTAIGTITDGVEKPTCTKKFKRRYVEEDDAASVITSEEDDCISPGYHTSLPMEVHGSCYSDMQMISEISYQKLKCPTVIITQHSFDLDTFTYHVISNLCQSNNKTYDVFYDWACEVVNVCPHSNSIVCILMAHFTARDQLPNSSKKCVNCSRNLDCAFHRKQFECRIFFTWNMETGVWDVLDYGQLLEVSNSATIIKADSNRCLTKIAKTLANELISDIQMIHNYTSNLNVLDSNVDKSKDSLIDINNSIEFYRKRAKLLRSEIQLN